MKLFAIFSRLFTGVILLTVWGLTTQPLPFVIFILSLTAASAIRYRFKPYKTLIPLEILTCLLYALIWPPALLGLYVPLIGAFELLATHKHKKLLSENHRIKKRQISLEVEQENVRTTATSSIKIAELNERARIAQDIHDHVGHEITGALIALQAASKREEIGSERADNLLKNTILRLESAYSSLRETIYNLKPAKSLSPLQDLCDNFTFCKINLIQSAESAEFSEILAANLKEALTNITRHSNATLVTVRVDENENYIRCTIDDNGTLVPPKINKNGLGLQGMKDRIHLAGGTLTVSREKGFKITQILPKRRDDSETINS